MTSVSTDTSFLSSDSQFEDEVRRVARLLWPAAEFDGAAQIAGRERDGIFITEECVHMVECTISRKAAKAEEDVKKLFHLSKRMKQEYPLKVVKGWFITLDEPTADQRNVVGKHRDLVVSLSYDQFRSKIVDARTYLQLRRQYPFGSVRDPEGKPLLELDFVPLNLIDSSSGNNWAIPDVIGAVNDAQTVFLLGDYGAGKSSTMREIFLKLADDFWKQRSIRFPLLLNLRDHHGQANPVEALERHGRNLAYPNPSHLVRAWRSGLVTLLLDGFDEIATAGWLNQSAKLRNLRFRAMELVREFIRQTPLQSGVILAGRLHFFDNKQEMMNALDLSSAAKFLSLDEFTDEQVEIFLRKNSWTEAIPTWLPARPLLLGYLASRNLIPSGLDAKEAMSPSAGWDALLGRICNRESQIEAGIDGGTIRKILERLASKARVQCDGLAPLDSELIAEVFKQVCGYAPDDRGWILLQRLPGLGVHSQEDGTRDFIDQDLVDVARAGDVIESIANPYWKYAAETRNWQCPMGTLGVEVAAAKCRALQFNSGKISSAIRHAADEGLMVLASDLIRIAAEMKLEYDGKKIFILDVIIPELDLDADAPSLAGIEFQDCMFQRIELDHGLEVSRLPSFVRCYFGEVEGRMGEVDLPGNTFVDCTFERFGESSQTTAAILASTLNTGTKVLLTILKKVYFQRGSGRKESALYRGLDHRARRLVPEVISLLGTEGLIAKSRCPEGTVWLPVRSESLRVQRILAAPNTSTDPLISRSAAV